MTETLFLLITGATILASAARNRADGARDNWMCASIGVGILACAAITAARALA